MKAAPTATAPAESLTGLNPRGDATSKALDAGASHTAQAEPDDGELVRRVQTGDEQAFRTLFERYHRRAFAVAIGVVKNQHDAMDVVQEAFLKVHRHLGNFQGSSSFYTWLYRIVMNLAIDHVRRARTAGKVLFDDERGRRDGGQMTATVGGPSDSNPDQTATRRELSEQLQNALAALPEHHQAVILLREVEGMSYEEMAQVLEVPKGTIMSRLFHARRKMQDALGNYLAGEQGTEA